MVAALMGFVDWCYRSVRQDRSSIERQEIQEEEDNDQEVHVESILQRVVHVRGRLRTDSGKTLID